MKDSDRETLQKSHTPQPEKLKAPKQKPADEKKNPPTPGKRA